MSKEYILMDLAVEPIHSIENRLLDNPNIITEQDSVSIF